MLNSSTPKDEFSLASDWSPWYFCVLFLLKATAGDKAIQTPVLTGSPPGSPPVVLSVELVSLL